MKRLLSITLALTFVLTLAIGSLAIAAPKYKDGTYKAEFSSFDSRGYKQSIVITVKGGKITNADFEAVNKDPKVLPKTKDANYESLMKKVDGIGPKGYSAALKNAIIKTQNPDNLGLKNAKNKTTVDSVTGATTASIDFKILAKAALGNAVKGVKTTAKVALPAGR